jgi:hypothetical protein
MNADINAMTANMISATKEEYVKGASCNCEANTLVNAINKKTIPEEKIHWYCLVVIDRMQKIDVLANKAVKSLI